MKFYLVFDKATKAYVSAYRLPYASKPSKASPRIYATHRHAASAATGWLQQALGPAKQITKELRQERFEIHEYEADEWKVIG
jgi:hypothetical protein